MTIDGMDIKEYGAQQWNVTPAYASITNNSQWEAGSLNPLILPGTAGLKKIKISVLIHGTSRQDIWAKGGKLVTRLLNPSIIKLDGFEHYFYLVLINPSQAESSIKRFHKATLEMAGYEYGDEVVVSTSAKGITIVNDGNLEAPAAIEIVPQIGKVSMEITGIVRNRLTGEDKPVTVQKLTKDRKIIIDGETGLITEGGVNKFPDVTLWDLPSLLPGENAIAWNQDAIDVTIKYMPRYL